MFEWVRRDTYKQRTSRLDCALVHYGDNFFCSTSRRMRNEKYATGVTENQSVSPVISFQLRQVYGNKCPV